VESASLEIWKVLIQAFGAIGAAIIVGVIGTLGGAWITKRYSRERDRQDKESQWRTHAIELTKLDAQRLLTSWNVRTDEPLHPFVLTFLANYRDLMELGRFTPKELYLKIRKDRIDTPNPPTEPRKTEGVTTSCAGGGPMGHPQIFLALQSGAPVKCPYCNQEFIASGSFSKIGED
jgi:uncharacterized Zn-finger protein